MTEFQDVRERITDGRLCLDFRPALSCAGAIKVKNGRPPALNANSSQFCNIPAFNESVPAEMINLTDGAALIVQSQLRVETYQAEIDGK